MTCTLTVSDIQQHEGIAGQFSVSCTVTFKYPDALDETHRVEFVGSHYGGPVVMVGSNGNQTMVDRASERFGEFGKTWVERFYAR